MSLYNISLISRLFSPVTSCSSDTQESGGSESAPVTITTIKYMTTIILTIIITITIVTVDITTNVITTALPSSVRARDAASATRAFGDVHLLFADSGSHQPITITIIIIMFIICYCYHHYYYYYYYHSYHYY